MNSGTLPLPRLIKNPEDLKTLATNLSRAPILAVDTESNSLFAYREQVCLIQFSTPEADYLVDPLALDDLSPLAPLFADRKIEKVFHAAEYDLICLKRDFGFEFNMLFDTLIAARILGREAVGLGSILEAEFDVVVNKRYQRANWGKRPLPDHLLDYARLDTHYLITLRDRLKAELEEKDLWLLALEDFKRLRLVKAEKIGTGQINNKKVDPWRVNGSYDLEPQQAAILLELCRYRDKKAQNLDRPLFKVIGDRTLLAIALEAPDNFRELKNLPGMSSKQINRHGKQLLSAVRRGLNAEPLHPTRQPRPDWRFLDRLEALREWRKITARTMGVKSDIVLPRDLLFALAEANPKDQNELESALEQVPWRLEKFGDQILDVLTQRNPK